MNLYLLSLLYYSAVQSSSRGLYEKNICMYLVDQNKTFTFKNISNIIIKYDNKEFLHLFEYYDVVLKTESIEDPDIECQNNVIKITLKNEKYQIELLPSNNLRINSQIIIDLDDNAEILLTKTPLTLYSIKDEKNYNMHGHVVNLPNSK